MPTKSNALRDIVIALIGSLIFAILGKLFGKLNNESFAIILLISGLVVALASLIIIFRRYRRALRLAATDNPSKRHLSLAEGTYIGMDLGRSALSVGALYYDNELDRDQPAPRVSMNAFEVPEWRTTWEVCKELAVVIGTHVRQNLDPDDRIQGLAVGLPGQVNRDDGTWEATPMHVADHLQFRHLLASEIVKNRDALGIFPTSVSDYQRRTRENLVAEIENRIRIDNDVNCAARALLSAKATSPNWRNFASVYVGGTGVGGGFVLNGKLYYGSDGTAGEIGHMAVDLPPITGSDEGLAWVQTECECGKSRDSVHWQTVISGEGFREIARVLNPRLYSQLEPEVAALAERLGVNPLQILIDVFQPELANAHGRNLPHQLTNLEAQELISRTMWIHGKYLAIGLASLLNLLNLDHIELGGGVVATLWELPPYRAVVYEELRGRTLHVAETRINGVNAEHLEGVSPAWKGAALMFFEEQAQEEEPH